MEAEKLESLKEINQSISGIEKKKKKKKTDKGFQVEDLESIILGNDCKSL
jgi:hypothetical protein